MILVAERIISSDIGICKCEVRVTGYALCFKLDVVLHVFIFDWCWCDKWGGSDGD
jgi:hypothetical protein